MMKRQQEARAPLLNLVREKHRTYASIRRGETILGPNNTSHGYVVVWLLRPKHSTVQVIIPQIRDKPYNHRQPEIYNSGASDT
ncbi:hypothetical protein J6590_011917 [Homalodisca vitripennis]|nr:hypothetical protein J6590_011917 [Homalodisca vitripennis]